MMKYDMALYCFLPKNHLPRFQPLKVKQHLQKKF